MPIKQFTNYKWLVEAIAKHNSDDCLIWPFSRDGRGYGQVSFNGKTRFAARVAFYIAFGRWPSPIGRHTCDVPSCINPRHIIEGTRPDNSRDMLERGRSAKGETHSQAKLTEQAIREIRLACDGASRGTITRVAIKYGVCHQAISRIVARKAWTHVH